MTAVAGVSALRRSRRGVRLRTVHLGDAERLAALYTENREYLRPWEPERDDAYFTVDGQRDNLRALVEAYAAEEMWPGVILVDGEIAGRITLNNILRGPLQSCFVGYWVARAPPAAVSRRRRSARRWTWRSAPSASTASKPSPGWTTWPPSGSWSAMASRGWEPPAVTFTWTGAGTTSTSSSASPPGTTASR